MTGLNLWDAHAHIQEPWFTAGEIDQLIKNATSSIEGIINVVSTPKTTDYQRGLELKKIYSLVHLNFGLQPTEASKDNFNIFKNEVEENSRSICAIGEVGLDYYWVKDKKNQQIQNDIFLEIIQVANQLRLPLVIHSRKAEDDCLNILEKKAEVPVLMHGMEASQDHIKRIVDLNFMITIPTTVCNRKKYKKIALRTPIEHILLETDAPFQLPFNIRPNEEREKNEPKNILKSAERIAELKEIPISDVAQLTRKNTREFFNL